MRQRWIVHVVMAVGLAAILASCNPYDPAQRAVGGGLVGAGTGAAIGAAAGGGTAPRLLSLDRGRRRRSAPTLGPDTAGQSPPQKSWPSITDGEGKRPSVRCANQPATGTVYGAAQANYQDQFVLDPEGNDIEGVLRGGE